MFYVYNLKVMICLSYHTLVENSTQSMLASCKVYNFSEFSIIFASHKQITPEYSFSYVPWLKLFELSHLPKHDVVLAYRQNVGWQIDHCWAFLLPLHSFDQHHVDIFDQVEYIVHNTLHIYTLCGIFNFPWHRHPIEGPTAFIVSSERHWQSPVKEIGKVSKRRQWDSNPRPLDCQLLVKPHLLATCVQYWLQLEWVANIRIDPRVTKEEIRGWRHSASLSVFARIERGQGADLGKGHFCARPIILRALLCVILHFEGTMGK